MMRKILLVVMMQAICLSNYFAQDVKEQIRISKDIELIKVSKDVYVHVSYTASPKWGRVSSNGMILINNGKAVLFDTPMTEELTKQLVDGIQSKLHVKVIKFVPNHWHEDCIGGLAYLHNLGIDSYANEMTLQIAKSKNLPIPIRGFKESLTLSLGKKKIFCEYLGAAHAMDNIVVWIPSEKILFAGCMAKEMNATNLGNTVDGEINAYPKTIKKVLEKYGDAKIVIPGHGQFGGIDLLKHTLDMCSTKN